MTPQEVRPGDPDYEVLARKFITNKMPREVIHNNWYWMRVEDNTITRFVPSRPANGFLDGGYAGKTTFSR